MSSRLSAVVAGLLASAGLVVVMAAPAQAAVTVTTSPGLVTFTSDAAGDTIIITCPTTTLFLNGVDTTYGCGPDIEVQGGGGDDVIDLVGLATSGAVDDITVDAGDGNDLVTTRAFTQGTLHQTSVTGGPGDDVLSGTDVDILKGGPGNDRLSDFGYTGNVLDGESGTDTYFFDFSPFGQVGFDVTPINGGLVIQVAGGPGQIFPWASIEALDLVMNDGANTVAMFAFDGSSRVLGNGGNDELVGGPGADNLVGGPGDDSIEGGGGADSVDGGDGNDVFRLRDGVVDTAACGAGADIVVADTEDVIGACETVDLLPIPTPPDTTKPGVVLKRAVYKSGTIKVPVACPAELRCLGTATLAAQGKVNGRKRVVKLDTLLVVLDGGKTERITSRLSKAERRAVLKLDGARLRVSFDLMDAGGNVAKGTVKVKLKLP